MNKLLARQIQKHSRETDDFPDSFKKLLEVISESYDHYEKDRKLIERSIELSSNEMIELNTELRKEKEDLKKAHKELKTLFENIDEVLFSVDMVSYKVTQMSAACEKVYGYAPSEFFADADLWQKVVHPEDSYKIKEQLSGLYKGKQIINQYRIINKDKSIRWIENNIIPTLDESGQLIRMDGVTNDITSRKLAEIELEKSFSIIEATLESTADGILVVDNNNKITRFNNKFLELWKIPPKILTSREEKNYIEFVLNQLVDPDAFVARIQQLYNSEEKVDFYLVHFKDGRVLERYSQPQLINRKYVGRVWSFRDVTERKKAEEGIRDSEEKRRLIMSGALDAIICIDTNDSITFWNPQAEVIFGWKEAEVMGQQLSELIVPEPFRKYHTEGIKHYLKTGVGKATNVLLELKAIRRSGEEFPIELTVIPIKQGADLFFCAFIRDITERKKAESERVKMISDIVQRNSDLEQFSYIVSHNLRAPTANIIGFTEILQHETLTPQEEKQSLHGLSKSATALDAVIKDINHILQVKSEVNEKKEVIILSKLVKDITNSIGNPIDKHGVRIISDFSEVDEIYSLKIYIYSIFYNLISNSIKYGKPNEAPLIEIKSKKDEGKLILTFQDNGLGIDIKTQGDKIFGLYSRFHSHVEGKGMGLFMVKTQVELLGGKITIASEFNKGTEFTIVLEN